MMDVRPAAFPEDAAAVFEVLKLLRPTLDEGDFLSQVERQMDLGYRLAVAVEGGNVIGVAGYRYSESFAWGRHCYIDDLVTAAQGKGAGRALMDWVVAEARGMGCRELHLDSGVQRFDAHRFYLNGGMRIASHHFMMSL